MSTEKLVMSHGEALAELHAVMNDKNHVMYDGWKRQSAMAIAYVEACYRAIPGGDTPVTFGANSITILTDKIGRVIP